MNQIQSNSINFYQILSIYEIRIRVIRLSNVYTHKHVYARSSKDHLFVKANQSFVCNIVKYLNKTHCAFSIRSPPPQFVNMCCLFEVRLYFPICIHLYYYHRPCDFFFEKKNMFIRWMVIFFLERSHFSSPLSNEKKAVFLSRISICIQ